MAVIANSPAPSPVQTSAISSLRNRLSNADTAAFPQDPNIRAISQEIAAANLPTKLTDLGCLRSGDKLACSFLIGVKQAMDRGHQEVKFILNSTPAEDVLHGLNWMSGPNYLPRPSETPALAAGVRDDAPYQVAFARHNRNIGRGLMFAGAFSDRQSAIEHVKPYYDRANKTEADLSFSKAANLFGRHEAGHLYLESKEPQGLGSQGRFSEAFADGMMVITAIRDAYNIGGDAEVQKEIKALTNFRDIFRPESNKTEDPSHDTRKFFTEMFGVSAKELSGLSNADSASMVRARLLAKGLNF